MRNVMSSKGLPEHFRAPKTVLRVVCVSTLVSIPSRMLDVGISYVVQRSTLFPSVYVRTALVEACSDSSCGSLSSLGCS